METLSETDKRAHLLRISILSGPFLPFGGGPSGAVEKLWFSLAREFAKQGHDVTCVSRQGFGLNQVETQDSVKIIRIPGFSRSGVLWKDLILDFRYSWHAVPQLSAADVTVTNTFWAPVLLGRKRQRCGKIVVNVNRFPKRQMWLYRSADRLSAVSGAVRDEIVRQTPSMAYKTRVIPNPIDTRIFFPDHDCCPPHGRRRILYTGRIHPEKGVHLLIAAVKHILVQFPDVELSLVGEERAEYGGGGEGYVKYLRSLAGDLQMSIEPVITDPSKLASRMRQADFYCYPSLADKGESFGVAPLEAMALGFAPILSSLECFRDFATHGHNAFVFEHRCADSAANLAAALREAMTSPEQTRAMGAAAAESAKYFSAEKVADMYIRDWQTLVKGALIST